MPPTTKGVKVQLDKERTLRFTLRTMSDFKAETGRDVLKGGFDDLDFDDSVTLIWLALRHEDKELTRDHVLDNVDLSDLVPMMAALSEIWKIDVDADGASVASSDPNVPLVEKGKKKA